MDWNPNQASEMKDSSQDNLSIYAKNQDSLTTPSANIILTPKDSGNRGLPVTHSLTHSLIKYLLSIWHMDPESWCLPVYTL